MIAQNYDGSTFVWNTTGLAQATYNVDVWVRQMGSGVAYQAFNLISYTLGPPTPCATAGLTSDKPSPQQVDFTITFTATSTGCANPQYLFYLQAPGGSWTVVQGYDGPTWVWDTSKVASIGTFNVDVWVRDASSSAPYQAFQLISYTLTNRVCSAAGLTSDNASPQAHGAVITFTATSAGCARPEYLFYLKGPGPSGTWSVVQGYDGNTWAWSTAGVASIGTYSVDVWVRALGSGVAQQTFQLINYTLT